MTNLFEERCTQDHHDESNHAWHRSGQGVRKLPEEAHTTEEPWILTSWIRKETPYQGSKEYSQIAGEGQEAEGSCLCLRS